MERIGGLLLRSSRHSHMSSAGGALGGAKLTEALAAGCCGSMGSSRHVGLSLAGEELALPGAREDIRRERAQFAPLCKNNAAGNKRLEPIQLQMVCVR